MSPFIVVGIMLLVMIFTWKIKVNRRYKNKDYNKTTVSSLLKKVKVSEITSIPCEIEGTIIGRGNPGCIFNEDFVIRDETGIIFLDYKQPLKLQDKIFALFKAPEYFNKTAKIKGWYRRSPVPYIEINTIEVDGKVKRLCSYPTYKVIQILGIILAVVLIILGIVM